MKFVSKHRVEIILLLILIALYFLLRLPNLTLQPIFADEAIYIRWAQVMRAEPTLRFLPLSDGKTPLFMWTMIPFFKVFSDPLMAGRFLSVLSGFFTLAGVFFLSKKVFNLKVALWASLIYVITPYTVFFDRMALVDSMLSAFSIWSLYFVIWLASSLRLDIAMILGFILGGGILTKTPAILSLLLLPLSILNFQRRGDKFRLVKLISLWAVAIFIALLMYNALRLGPNFNLISSRNGDYVFSLWELRNRPLDPFIPHLHDMQDWFPKLFTFPILTLVFLGIFYLLTRVSKKGWIIFLWALLPMLISMAFLKTFTARYLLSSIPPLLILAGFGLERILQRISLRNGIKIAIALLAILPIALNFDYQLISSPPPQNLPKEERKGYFEDWTAGYGLKDIAAYLIDQSKSKSVLVGTEGFFGTLPDGLQIYLDKSKVTVIGSSSTISAQVRNALKDHEVFFVGNKRTLKGNVSNVNLIKEYLKAAPSGKEDQDATVLYKVFP